MSTIQPNDTQPRWYMVNKDGMCTLCADQADAEKEAKDAQDAWPHMGPHRAVQLVEASQAFTASDMATASAQGFRDGVASLAANAGSEAVAWPTTPADVRAFVGSHFSSLFYGDPDAGELKPHENDSYEMTAHDLISAFRWWAECHPSPPEGMAGWRQGVEAAAALLSKKADDFAKEHGYNDMGGLSFGRGANADVKLDYHSGLLELVDEVLEMRANAPLECRSDNPVLMEHSGCGRGTQVDTLTVRLNPGDKVILCPGPVTRASIAAAPPLASEAKGAGHADQA